MAGADTVQLVSSVLLNGPERVSSILEELESWMSNHQHTSLDEIRGCMNYQNCADPEALERANYMKILKSWG
ncbi:MAG TPA: hypothetical protein DCX06_04120 [Opitutae bacterium]|nr:hypothetical protein [Opitutae bacterium]